MRCHLSLANSYMCLSFQSGYFHHPGFLFQISLYSFTASYLAQAFHMLLSLSEAEVLVPIPKGFILIQLFVSVNLYLDKSTTINCLCHCPQELVCQKLQCGGNLHYLIVSYIWPLRQMGEQLSPIILVWKLTLGRRQEACPKTHRQAEQNHNLNF